MHRISGHDDERPDPLVLLRLCNHNAGRSQMAQAFFERYGRRTCVRADSTGNEPILLRH